MARAFDICLRDRLAEFDLVLHNLSYREYISVNHKILLDAMIQSLFLQKFLMGENSGELREKIDCLLEQVFCRCQSGALFSALATSYMVKWAEATNLASQISVSMLSYAEQCDVLQTADGDDIWTSDGVELCMWRQNRSISTPFLEYCFNDFENGADLILSLSMLVKGVSEVGTNKSMLDSNIMLSAEKFDGGGLEGVLKVGTVDIFYVAPIELNSVVQLLEIRVDAILQGFHKLYEMDTFVLKEIDAMTLGDLDYVVLTS